MVGSTVLLIFAVRFNTDYQQTPTYSETTKSGTTFLSNVCWLKLHEKSFLCEILRVIDILISTGISDVPSFFELVCS